MGSITSTKGIESVIKSVQRGSIAITALTNSTTAMPSPVDPGRAFITLNTVTAASDRVGLYLAAYLASNGTQVVVSRGINQGTAVVVRYELVEFH